MSSRGVLLLLTLLQFFDFTTVHADFRLQASLLQSPMCTLFRCYPSYTMPQAPRVRGVLVPMQSLVDSLLNGCRRSIELIAKCDNTQAIGAAHKGYSKKLRFLEKVHRCSIGSLNELVTSGAMRVEYHPTATLKADIFTKPMTPAKFVQARELIGMISNT